MGPPSTPVPVSLQIHAWQQGNTIAGPSILEPKSPHHPHFGEILRFDRPKKLHSVDNCSLPPGFHASSLIHSQHDGEKGKVIAMKSVSTSLNHWSQDAPPPFPLSNTVCQLHTMSQRVQEDIFTTHVDRNGSGNFAPINVDIEGSNLILAKIEVETERIKLLNWTVIVHLLICPSHSLHWLWTAASYYFDAHCRRITSSNVSIVDHSVCFGPHPCWIVWQHTVSDHRCPCQHTVTTMTVPTPTSPILTYLHHSQVIRIIPKHPNVNLEPSGSTSSQLVS